MTSSSWSELAEALTPSLMLTTPPIAITFDLVVAKGVTRFECAKPTFAADGRSGRVPAGCVFWTKSLDSTFSLVAGDHANCSVGILVHGCRRPVCRLRRWGAPGPASSCCSRCPGLATDRPPLASSSDPSEVGLPGDQSRHRRLRPNVWECSLRSSRAKGSRLCTTRRRKGRRPKGPAWSYSSSTGSPRPVQKNGPVVRRLHSPAVLLEDPRAFPQCEGQGRARTRPHVNVPSMRALLG